MRALTRTLLAALITLVFSAAAFAQYSQPVRDVENPARTPFWGYASGTIAINWVNTVLLVGTVPPGQRLVIEHVSANCTADADDNISRVSIQVTKKEGAGWSSYQVPVVVQKQGNTYDGKSSWAVSQPMRFYSDSIGGVGTQVDIRRSKLTATAVCWTVVSGYTISTP